MRRHIVFGAVVSAALAASPVLAQSPGTQPGSSTASPSQSRTDDRNQSSRNRSVTVTGCLQDAAKSTTGSSASSGSGSQMSRSGSAAGDAKFILTNARSAAGSRAAASASGTAGTSGSATPYSQSAYQLIGGGSEDLSKYVNQRVEVRGTLVPDASTGQSGRSSGSSAGSTGGSTGSSSGSGSPSGSTPGSGSMSGTGAGGPASADLPKLRVTSVRSISGSCSDVQR